jgi:hypothetical protein
MKYLESYKLFERVTVPSIKTNTDKSDSGGCGNCSAAKTGNPLLSPPRQTFQALDNYQNLNKPTLKGQKKDPYVAQIQIFLQNNQGAGGRINSIFNSAKNWYTGHYMKPETFKKFKKKENRDKLVNFINKEIKLAYWNRNSVNKNSDIFKDWQKEYSNAIGWVWSIRPDWINLNMENYKEDPDYKETIPHELGHCIYHKLEQLGEDPISGNKDASTSISPNFRETGINPYLSDEESTELEKKETYLLRRTENQTRLMSLRRLLNIGSVDTCEQIKQKFEKNLENGKLKFDYLTPSGFVKNKNGDCYWLKLEVPEWGKKWLLAKDYQIAGKPRLARIYKILTCSFDGKDNLDFSRLFSIFSVYKDGFIWLNLSKLTKLNLDVVTNDSPDDFNKKG